MREGGSEVILGTETLNSYSCPLKVKSVNLTSGPTSILERQVIFDILIDIWLIKSLGPCCYNTLPKTFLVRFPHQCELNLLTTFYTLRY